MKFSIMLATRKHPVSLKKVVDNIFEMTYDKENIEIVFGIDDDDMISRLAIKDIKEQYPDYNFTTHSRPRTNSLVDAVNTLAKNFSKGKYLLQMNDDALIRTENWDIKCYERLEKYLSDKPDGIVYGIVEDCEKYATFYDNFMRTDFPIFSKNCIEALGFAYDPHFVRSGADDDISRFYAMIGRALDLRDICIIEHHAKELESGEIFDAETDIPNLDDKTAYVVWKKKTRFPKDIAGDYRIRKIIKYITKYETKG